jgi:hypothetical protein
MPRGGARPGAGRPRKPALTRARTMRERVAIAAAFGMDHEEIAIALRISREELSKRYAAELSTAVYRCRIDVMEALYRCALSGSVAAARLFLKNSPTITPPPVGKKEAAQRAAVGAETGTDWQDLLPATTTRQ